MKEIIMNPLGDTQREQWHSVVHLLRTLGGDLDRKGRSDICSELDRYIDHVEDILDELRNKPDDNEKTHVVVYVEGGLVQSVYANKDMCVDVYDRDNGLTDDDDNDLRTIVRNYKHVW